MTTLIKRTLFISIGGAIGAGLAVLVAYVVITPFRPKPISDVPIEREIGWWPFQDSLTVNKLLVEVPYKELSVFNYQALVQYTISGTLQSKYGGRPYVKAVFVSERWDKPTVNFFGNSAHIEIVPIIEEKSDNAYRRAPVAFEVVIQDYLSTGGWGKNTYKVTSQSKEQTIELVQVK
jgi:hypothetical protein